MKVLIIEDEAMARQKLARTLTTNFPDMELVGMTSSVKESVAWLQNDDNHADVIFMDVELSDGECFEIFRQVRVTSQVIMTTAYDSHAVRAFEVNSIDYLLKPIELSALHRAVERCRNRERFDSEAIIRALNHEREYKQRFLVRFNDRIVPVRTSDIAYFYSEEKNTYLVTFDGNRYVMDLSLEIISEETDQSKFFRISRNSIVSMASITSVVKYLGNRLKVHTKPRAESELIVSRSRVEDFLRWLEEA